MNGIRNIFSLSNAAQPQLRTDFNCSSFKMVIALVRVHLRFDVMPRDGAHSSVFQRQTLEILKNIESSVKNGRFCF